MAIRLLTCASIKIPSIPAATPARERTGKYSLAPPLGSALGIPYFLIECVTSKTTG